MTPEIEATTAGNFLKYVEEEFAAPSYARRLSGNTRLVRLERYVGVPVKATIADLEELLFAYRHGFVKESERKK